MPPFCENELKLHLIYMSKNLMIVESPHKGETIAKYLDKSFRVMSSQGHIRDIEGIGKNSIGIDFNNHYTPNYTIDANKAQLVNRSEKRPPKPTWYGWHATLTVKERLLLGT